MTENKQITIYDLLPLVRKGYIVMQPSGDWYYCKYKPSVNISRFGQYWYIPMMGNEIWNNLSKIFNIAPFDGDWKDSLMEVK